MSDYQDYGTNELLIAIIRLLEDISAKLPDKPTSWYKFAPAPTEAEHD
jgi:hypothetical protein